MINKLTNVITKPLLKIYSSIRGNNIVQTREQTITNLLGFYLSSISLASFLTVIINKGIVGESKEAFVVLGTAIGVKLSYDFIRDVIATEFDAGTRNIEQEVNNKFQQNIFDLSVKIENSTSIKNLDKNYLSYLQQYLGHDNFKLQGVNQELKSQYSEDRLGFKEKLDNDFTNSKNTRKVRCIIHDLNDTFLHQLAVEGIIHGLDLKLDDVLERTKTGNDLHSLRVDIYAYLSAWLICSIDNDLGVLMSIEPIGMRYMKEKNVPDKETYKKIIHAIQEVIRSENKYKNLIHYPDSDPLACDLVKDTILRYLDKLIVIVDKYSYREIAKS